MVLRALKDRIQLPLTDDERAQRTEDGTYLNSIADQKVRFEEPDARRERGNAEGRRTSGGTTGPAAGDAAEDEGTMMAKLYIYEANGFAADLISTSSATNGVAAKRGDNLDCR